MHIEFFVFLATKKEEKEAETAMAFDNFFQPCLPLGIVYDGHLAAKRIKSAQGKFVSAKV